MADLVHNKHSSDNEDVESGPAAPTQPMHAWSSKGDPFGDEKGAQVKYKTLSWWKVGMIMIAETIALGILSLPSALATVGMAPGIILIVGLGLLATYTGYNLGQFKLAYPHVHNMADAGEILFGVVGREVFGAAQLLFLIFLMGSHILTFSIMLNTLSEHGTCTIVFSLIGMIVSIICTLPRTLLNVSYLAIASFISVFAAVLITMIGIGIERPSLHVDATTSTSFYSGFLAVTNIVFAYAGHVNFFTFISEMRNPKEYAKGLYLLQFADTTFYTITAIVIYRYGGPDVASPALGSTSSTVRKVAYGIAIPTIVIAGVINGHVATKMIYIRLFRGKSILHERSVKSYGIWTALVVVLYVIAWVIAEAIPVFNNLLGLMTALFASWFTYGLSGYFWLFLRRGHWFESPKNICLTIINILVFAIGAAICGLGLYASGKSIADDSSTASFSCANNA